jgi:hypothetical protein
MKGQLIMKIVLLEPLGIAEETLDRMSAQQKEETS